MGCYSTVEGDVYSVAAHCKDQIPRRRLVGTEDINYTVGLGPTGAGLTVHVDGTDILQPFNVLTL